MTIFYMPNPTQHLNITTTLLTINKQKIKSLLRQSHSFWFVHSEIGS